MKQSQKFDINISVFRLCNLILSGCSRDQIFAKKFRVPQQIHRSFPHEFVKQNLSKYCFEIASLHQGCQDDGHNFHADYYFNQSVNLWLFRNIHRTCILERYTVYFEKNFIFYYNRRSLYSGGLLILPGKLLELQL